MLLKLYLLFFRIAGQVNLGYLRVQQNTLSVLNATRILHSNQYKLRKVLRYSINSIDQSEEQHSIEEEFNHQPILLIQKLLTKATQPSPLKPGFSLQEMQLAALNLSQYLAAEASAEISAPCTINNEKASAKNQIVKENPPELVTPNSECSVKSVVSEKAHKKKKNEETNQAPVNPIISQIMEMGFTRKSVGNAIKASGNFFFINLRCCLFISTF